MVATGVSEVKTPGLNLPSLTKREEGAVLLSETQARGAALAAPGEGEDEKEAGRQVFSNRARRHVEQRRVNV